MPADQQAIFDIIGSIQLVFEYTKDIDWETVRVKDQDAIVRRLTIIGEATKRLSKEFRSAHPTTPRKGLAESCTYQARRENYCA
ncbi:MAG: DUF86 domain-containing protein [Elainellaceae cyanobacterium]